MMSNPSSANNNNGRSTSSPFNNYINISQKHDRINNLQNATLHNINETDQNEVNRSQNHDRCMINELNNNNFIRNLSQRNNRKTKPNDNRR